MITLFHFIRLAVHNLCRGGQRVLVALLCITFGITTLVAMTMIAKSIESTMMVEPAQLVGGDLSLVRAVEENILPTHVNQLESLQHSGEIDRYTLIAYDTSSIMFHTLGSGELHFVGTGMGIEPEKYPLAGSLTIGEPDSFSGKINLPELLGQAGDVVVTRDIALEYNLKVGDPIVLSDLRTGIPLAGTLRGIAYDTPNHKGDKIYYTIETAQKLAGGQPVVNTAIVNTQHAHAVSTELSSSGWTVDWVAQRREGNPANMWVIGLRGAGILGLLVGGIGIANTMQVLLRRRQREIAIWKTLGYRESELGLIFSLEAGLLGLAGSLAGAGLGVLISGLVLELIRRLSSVLYQGTFSSTPPLMGVLVGTLTTVIFASWAIVVSSQARPMALLRSERIDDSVRGERGTHSGRPPEARKLRKAKLILLLAAPFTVLISLVMESVAAGIAVLFCAAAGIAALGGFFRVLLWFGTRLLPLRGFPLVHMAVTSLRRRGSSLVFAMIALFAGVLSMSLGLAVTQFGERKISTVQPADFHGYNINILATADQESIIRQAVQAEDPKKVGVAYRAVVDGLSVAGGGPVSAMDRTLVGLSDSEDYIISGDTWGSQPDGVYVNRKANLKPGSQIEVTFPGGTTKTFTVAGAYAINQHSTHLYPPTGLLMPAEAFKRVAWPDSLIYFVQVDSGQVSHVAAELGAALPQATVVDLAAYAARFMHGYQKLFVLPMIVSGLALLAGLLLMANSVSLAMLDRRYEIGILKTVGYSRRQIIFLFGVEYGLVGLLSTGAGVMLIEGFLVVVAVASHLAASILLLAPRSLALIAFCGVGLTLLIVFGITWDTARTSPVAVLNEGTGGFAGD